MDLAETVDDLICTFDGTGDTTMDTLAMFIFGWILAALFVLWLGRLAYDRFIGKMMTLLGLVTGHTRDTMSWVCRSKSDVDYELRISIRLFATAFFVFNIF